MASTPPDSEGVGSRLGRKFREAPYVPIGIAGFIGAVAYGIYGFRKRGATPASVYVIHTRLRAQGAVVGALTAGVLYTLLRDYVFKVEEVHKVQELHPSDKKAFQARHVK